MSRRIIGLGLWIVGLTISLSVAAAPQINMGDIPAGKKVTITYDVTVNNDTTGNQISSQATVSGNNFVTLNSDDPDTATAADATATDIDGVDTSLALSASDLSPLVGEPVNFTATVSMSNTALPDPAGNVEFRVDGGAPTIVALDASGSAAFSMSFNAGTYNVTADYIGGLEYSGSNSSVTVTSSLANNNAPTITPINDQAVAVGDTLTFTVSAFDNDPGAVISYSLAPGAPAGSTIDNVTGVFTLTPTEAQAGTVYPVTVIAEDQFAIASQESFNLSVQAQGTPLLQNDTVAVNEDRAISFAPLNNDTASNGFDLSSLSIESSPQSGTLEVDAATGRMTYRGTENFNGADKVRYKILDNSGVESNIAVISIVVNPVNDLPLIESTPNEKVVELDSYKYNVVAIDVDGDPVQLTAPTLPAWLQLVGNQLMGTPQNSDLGQHNVVLRASDGVGFFEQTFEVKVVSANSNDLYLEQETSSIAPLVGESFNLTYTVVNDGPVAASNVVLTIDLQGSVDINNTDSRCTINGLTLDCNLGTVALNDSTTVELDLSSNQLGDVYSAADIQSPDDEVLDNNQLGLGVSITNGTMVDKAAVIGEAEAKISLAGDFGGDSAEDIILLEGSNSIGSVFINEGPNTFTKYNDILGYEKPTDALLVDVNNDDLLDLIVATKARQHTLIYRGAGDGVFKISQTLEQADSYAIDAVDINSDGFVDLVVANKGDNQVYLNNNGEMQFSHQLGDLSSQAVVLSDINGDGLIDSLFGNDDGSSYLYTNAQLLNTAAPANDFTVINTGLAKDIQVIDIDRDGADELIVTVAIKDSEPSLIPENKIYKWSGNLNQVQTLGAVDSQQVIVADVDNDQDQDLFVRNSSGAHQIYLNEAGALTVTDKLLVNVDASFATWIMAGDGDTDLLLAEGLSEGSAYYSNKGNGEFGISETDLALSYQASATSITEQGVVTISFRVTNNGPSSAQAVEFNLITNSLVKIVDFGSGIDGCTLSDNALDCSLANMDIGQSVNIPLRVVLSGVGEARIDAEVSTAIEDFNLSNNSVVISVQATPRRDGGGGQVGLWLLLLLGLATIRRKYKLS